MRLLLLVLLSLTCVSACLGAGAQTSRFQDQTYERVLRDRSAFQRVVHLRGDSYMRGFPLGFFEDEATPEQRKHPLWNYRSPASTFNALAPDGVVAAYAGLSGQPNPYNVAKVEAEIEDQLRRDIIRDGDVVVFADAGLHHGSPRQFLLNWLRLRRIFEDRNIVVAFVTSPDRIRRPAVGAISSQLYRYDFPFEGLSHNDATRIAAENHHLIDLARLIHDAEAAGRSVMLDDIHYNVEGQCLLVSAIFELIHAQPRLPCAAATDTAAPH